MSFEKCDPSVNTPVGRAYLGALPRSVIGLYLAAHH